jgi:SAM-dependent methyltransferase
MTPPATPRDRAAVWKARAYAAIDRFVPTIPFRYMGRKQTVRLAYNVILDREPEPSAYEVFVADLEDGAISRRGISELLIHSEETRAQRPITDVLLSMHVSRSEFVRGMPKASQILDLGGTHQGYADGALVHLGYPYAFDRLLVVDLPPEERHEIYRGGSDGTTVQSPLGLVEFAFHSMTELERYPDQSFDLVYSGQSIEHVTEADGLHVFAEVFRLLEPGGWFCLDTPNGPVWRLQTDEMMNPDHKIEYAVDELILRLRDAGFEITEVKGLNYMGTAATDHRFDEAEASANPGVFAEAADCLLLAVIARKPL